MIETFVNRLKKIDIEVDLAGNYPWIYISHINGKRVTETFRAEHGFTIAFITNDGIKFTNLKEIFVLIRKYLYLCPENK